MPDPEKILLKEEYAALKLRALFAGAGYRQYKMSKFEEYDLYANNKDFLASERIITFTDISGRLMALKPDVTLSIIKNTEPVPGKTEKLYYNETVYRAPKGAPGFREMPQVGLECIGNTGPAEVAQVIGLACGSLMEISADCVLDVSHFGLVTGILEASGLTGAAAGEAVGFLNEKNAHGLSALCSENGVTAENTAKLKQLITLNGAPDLVLPKLRQAFGPVPAITELETVIEALSARQKRIVRIDFSVPGNLKYYNGIVFKGYVRGVPAYVLSGGQYDGLMKRMRKNGRALGFAVYLDSLQQLNEAEG